MQQKFRLNAQFESITIYSDLFRSIQINSDQETNVARVHVLKETTNDPAGDWQLWYQWCRYELDDGVLYGYRFIWRRPDGTLQAARGGARIPNSGAATALMEQATKEGWGDRDGDKIEAATKRLKDCGCVVSLDSGYVGWPNRETALKEHLTAEMIDDAKLIREWS